MLEAFGGGRVMAGVHVVTRLEMILGPENNVVDGVAIHRFFTSIPLFRRY